MSNQEGGAGIRTPAGFPLFVREGRLQDTEERPRFIAERETHHLTLGGVEVLQAQAFIDERRVLVVTHNSKEPPGILGYTVVVRPGFSVGDHYHHRREERILLLHGRGEFRLLDQRPHSPTYGRVNVLTLDYPGSGVRIPAGIAHSIIADGAMTVLQVLASSDYDPHDDVHILLSRWISDGASGNADTSVGAQE
jgi:dTDP-4-dehydrorhamnose 3,5-epimerase-like enzyme